MNRTRTNYIVDLILLLLFIIVAFTGFFMYLVIPEGIPQGRYQDYMGLTKATWTMIHNKSSILLTVFVAVHFILHWKWITYIKRNFIGKSEKRKDEYLCEEKSPDQFNS
ncbi:DUF4405 domain-containing protein [Methanococcoides orientis]|uniref:DUF4405 domain-containing protein n=1 Tax=Methanococcoides orientis TaxID=2822137 RepID=UPI001E4E1E37|nr:DUF4405 domain-containing protein [Methanococcoides orientis]UGV41253.1 DUF4405 domain-containing protein [Methanococcoides orientis]